MLEYQGQMTYAMIIQTCMQESHKYVVCSTDAPLHIISEGSSVLHIYDFLAAIQQGSRKYVVCSTDNPSLMI